MRTEGKKQKRKSQHRGVKRRGAILSPSLFWNCVPSESAFCSSPAQFAVPLSFSRKIRPFFRYFLLAHVNFCFALDVFRKGGRLLQKYCGIKTDSLLCFCLLILLEQEKRRKICGEMNLEGPLHLLLRFFSLTSGDTGEEKVPEVISNFFQTTGEMGAIVFVQVRIRFAKFVIFL